MKKRALALAVVGACGLVPQAFAHELAVSKKDHIKVDVPGEASNWCKPEIELTIRRPVWDNQALLTGLVGKLPIVLANDCPAARVTWRAVDASGNLYASGSGTAANLGIVTLASARKKSSPAVIPSPSSVEASALVDQSAPPTNVVAPVTNPDRAHDQPPVQQDKTVQQLPPQPSIAAAPSAQIEQVHPDLQGSSAPAAITATPASDFGKALVLEHSKLTQITDAGGCKWVMSKSVLNDGDGSLAFDSTPSMPCPSTGFAEGSFEKLSWKVPNTYRGDNWNRVFVHASGLMFNKDLESVVKGKELSYLSPDADQALFLLGEIPSRQMKVYLAFQRGNYRVLGPFNSDPYYVAITPDESFALDPVDYKRAGEEVFQLIRTSSPSTVSVQNFYVAKSLAALFPKSGWGEDAQKIIRNRIGESRGQFYFDVKDGSNWALQREQQRLLEERRVQQHMAELHSRVLDRYEQLKAGMKDYEGKEVEALAQMAGIQVRFGSPLALQDPNSSKSVGLMMIHVVGKTDGSYDIDFPAKGRLLSNQTFEKEWYVVPVANLTPFMPLVDGRALPTFRGNLPAAPEACKQDHCADKVSFGAVLAREFGPDSGIDFNWTPDVSQQYVNTWKNASAQLQ
ncbi:hypothetical protein CKA47_27455 [Pseudomonas aeruginosa]|uniref:Uncharacterized protein n=2 Tax=Pseudomonas TaxID=286 RepID=A0A2R3J5T8_9PSED|nr:MULTISPECIES: hypothetical protein [Pseudomonas]AVK09540.1 hypothetical protein CSB93_6948 [Pseudomonas paraeruginosa]AWE95811.1 hypothetical protein CSC28_6938 [Pseudomonas paraeruginosa]KSH19912.1 hypothetical protein AO963_22500 [Pseudomonas aeruginosa]MBF8699933.1 hypothetical protein [Pseudomonas putida]MBF8705224.1 hypothetical protein [Pseudomonas putida]